MIRISYLPLLIIIFSCTANTKQKVEKNKERFYLKAIISEIKIDSSYNYFSIMTNLINDTKDTIKYASNSCSWQDFYIIDKEQLIVNRKLILNEIGCDHDYPQLKTILPYSTDETKILKFKFKKSFKELHHLIFKVGFYFLPVINSEDAWDKAKKQNNLRNVIWENWDKTKQQSIFKDVIWSDSLVIP